MLFRSRCLSPDNDPAPATPAAPSKVTGIVDRYIARYGNAESALRALAEENFALQATTDGHASALAEMRKQIPAAGSVVLTGDDAKTYQAFKALNLAPDKLTAALTERDALKGTVASAERAVHARAAAVAAGLDPDAFIDHVGLKGLVIEMRDVSVTEKGKAVTKKLPFVRPGSDEKALFVAASEYVAKLPAHEQRALAATAAAPTGTPAHAQQPTPSGGTPPGDPVTDYLTKRNALAAARPNPLAPRQPAAAAAS